MSKAVARADLVAGIFLILACVSVCSTVMAAFGTVMTMLFVFTPWAQGIIWQAFILSMCSVPVMAAVALLATWVAEVLERRAKRAVSSLGV